MKKLILLLQLFLVIVGYSQEMHTYGPITENNWHTVQGAGMGPGPNSDRYIGTNIGPPNVTYILFSNWIWDYTNIPTEATLVSVNISFSIENAGPNQRNLQFSFHSIESNWPINNIGTYHYNVKHNDQRLVYTSPVIASNSNGVVNFNQIITTGLLFNKFQQAITSGNYYITLAMRSEDGVEPWWILKSPISITFNYSTPNQTFQFINKMGTNEAYGHLILDNNLDNEIPSGTPTFVPWGYNHTIRTDELPFVYNWLGTGSTQKHRLWYNTLNPSVIEYVLNKQFNSLSQSPHVLIANFDPTIPKIITNYLLEAGTNLGQVEFRDPFKYHLVNNIWQQSNTYITYTIPFSLSNNSSNSYGGVFLNQSGPNTGWTPPFYSVRSQPQDIILTQTNQSHRFYLYNWSAVSGATFQNESADETGVMFTNDGGAAIKANLKGTQLSNFQGTFVNNSQRKFLRSDDGWLHNVYISLGHVWYETSSDNGNTWNIIQGGQSVDIDAGTALSPSIAVYNDAGSSVAFITYVKNTTLYVKLYYYQSDTYITKLERNISVSSPNPVTVYSTALNKILVIYRSPTGLRYALAGGNSFATFAWTSNSTDQLIPNTDANSYNPTLAGNSPFDVAWEQRLTNPEIRYCRLILAPYDYLTAQDYAIISTSSGYPLNTNPSITVVNTYPAVGWYGTPYSGSTSGGAIYRQKASGGWGTVWSRYGSSIASPNVASMNNGNTAFVWSEQDANGQTFDKVYKQGSAYDIKTPGNATMSGRYLQVSNGSNYYNSYVTCFTNTAVPYFFTVSKSVGSLTKENTDNNISVDGRTVVLTKDSTEAFFTIQDIRVDSTIVNFPLMADTLVVTRKELDNYLISNPFNVNDKSSITFDVNLWSNDSTRFKGLNEKSKFKLELALIDDENKTVSKVVDKSMGGASLFNSNKLKMNVKAEGYSGKQLRLKMSLGEIESGFTASLIRNNISDAIINADSKLGKQIQNIAFTNKYDLFQNYPNPFNPTTVISYQLPKATNIKLRIYDALGKQVAVLVDEFKDSGRYNVQFNAANLASGIYLYELRADDFVTSKKMLLIK